MAVSSKTVFNRWMKGNGRESMMKAITARKNKNTGVVPTTPKVPNGMKLPGRGPLPPKPEGPIPNVPRTSGNSGNGKRLPGQTPPIINRGNYR